MGSTNGVGSRFQSFGINELEVVVVSGDRTVFLKGFGVASIETGLPVTPDTLFYSGGLSRLFTSAALVSLAEEGKVDLSTQVGRYVTGLSPKLARLTGHQLLTSTAGLGEEHLRHALVEDSAPSCARGATTVCSRDRAASTRART